MDSAGPKPIGYDVTLLSGTVRQDWTREEVAALFDLPFPDLMFRAQSVHR